MREVTTVLGALTAALQAAGEYNRNDQVAPAAVLWSDGERRWEPLLGVLRRELPHLLTLGAFDPATRTGPAIWLTCALARALPEMPWPAGKVPVVYLPGVSRAELRAVEDCPEPLQPLAELQYRGVLWSQANGRDWTPLAFLKSPHGGLGLDVAQDGATTEALSRALSRLAALPVAGLRGRRIDAAFLDDLLNPDKARRMLTWLDNPAAARDAMTPDEWAAFTAVCRKEYELDPERDGEMRAAELLGSQNGPWAMVWQRFVEAPELSPGLPPLLRRARPKTRDMFYVEASWPQENETGEGLLRAALLAMVEALPAPAAKQIAELDGKHGLRRGWVWAKLGQAPLAETLQPLRALAEITSRPLAGATPDEMAAAYAERGCGADLAVLQALDLVASAEDKAAVAAAIRAMYLPWIEQASLRLQAMVTGVGPRGGRGGVDRRSVAPGSAIVFVDGLRFDVGMLLRQACLAKGWRVEMGWRWAPLPSVTATAKPAASLVGDQLGGHGGGFVPLDRVSGKPATSERLRELMLGGVVELLAAGEVGKGEGVAWTECGSLDRFGHDEGAGLARRLNDVLDPLVARISALFVAGWRRVHVVTDHGWLLLPGGLPHAELQVCLLESRWGRCALPTESARVPVPTCEFHWDPGVQVALAPGVSTFVRGMEYAHGGLSVHECVVPELTIVPTAVRTSAELAAVGWSGLRCRAQVAGGGQGMSVALRSRAGDPSSTLAGPRALDPTGSGSLLVTDDALTGTAAFLVLLDDKGTVIAHHMTTVGE
ncbi:MAG: BREX-1 system phosphatase PglZ type B [Thermoanaerobaculaceae bacterium]|nr:BREX-1 system phosphatase PglZ type B [Thermoanaerobaculaceae bacterium]MDI9621908.1 BREX-1 system phosphatase PglZ type B [Acidobacteriota bacterium]NLH11616.1 BREX-1 system phosphatase PglZ type B [Holophagae bacterium]